MTIFSHAPMPCLHRAGDVMRSVMKAFLGAACIAVPGFFGALPAVAGDPAAGQRSFAVCRACHGVVAPDGTPVMSGGRTGPDLYGIVGRPVASQDGYRYSPGLMALGAAGRVWTEEDIVAFAADPTAFVRTASGNAAARSTMSVRLSRNVDDIAAWLASVGK